MNITEEYYDDIDNNKSSTENKTTEVKKDKIFDNDYNQGTIEIDYNTNLTVDLDYQATYLGSCYNEDYILHKELSDKIFNIMNESKWDSIFKRKKKITNENIPVIYIYIKNKLKGSTYTNIEIFTAISEVLDISFKKLYDNVNAKFKEELLSELDNKLGIFKKKRIKKLF